MHIPPISLAIPCSAPFDPIAVQKNSEPVATETSLFRAWTRGSGKVLTTTDIAAPLLRSDDAFWAQWPKKQWRRS